MNRIRYQNLLLLLIFGYFIVSCQERDCANILKYSYNPDSGNCENCNGDIGFNDFNIENIRATKNAECIDLSGQNLVYLLDTSKIENFNESGYNNIEHYNFKGSKFDSAKLFFNNILAANLEGADLSKIDYGYATIKGQIDQYTVFPDNGMCSEIKNDSISCTR